MRVQLNSRHEDFQKAKNYSKYIQKIKECVVSHRGWAAVKPPSGRLSCPSTSWWRLPGPGAPPAQGPTLSCPPGQDSPPCTGAELQQHSATQFFFFLSKSFYCRKKTETRCPNTDTSDVTLLFNRFANVNLNVNLNSMYFLFFFFT